MNIEYRTENSLPPYLLKKGVKFIRRRFQEVWGIHRTDVTYGSVLSRRNIILFDNSKIIGWLGIENDGQLTNACIEKGYRGVYNLVELIKEAYRVSPLSYLYANVPISKTASARAFLTSGMNLEKNPHLIRLRYPEGEMVLVRLSIDLKEKAMKIKNQDSIEIDLKRIRGLNYVYYRDSEKNMGIHSRKS